MKPNYKNKFRKNGQLAEEAKRILQPHETIKEEKRREKGKEIKKGQLRITGLYILRAQ
jgi:hypothetical protein